MVKRHYRNIGLLILTSFLTLLLAEAICRVYLIVRFRTPDVMYQNYGYEFLTGPIADEIGVILSGEKMAGSIGDKDTE